MIYLKQTKVTEWIISGNPEQYNVVDAFHNLHRVDWAQKANMTAGDIVYIYVSGNVKAIKFKCRVNKADLDESDIDDREYDLSGQFDGTAGRYMELELLEEYVGDEYSREELMKHGFRSPQGPIRMPESVKQYLESISVFEHRYPVNTAVWIATALLSAESFDSNPVCSKKDMYFKQTAIIQRAQKLAESSVANARCSQWCCADNDNSSNNYLRGDSEENSSLRRLSLLDEFPEKTHPEGLNMADELTMNGNKITMEELFYFVREQYPTIIGNDSKIDYIGVLDYLRDNTDVPYSKPDAPGLAAEEVSRLLEVKKKGQNAIAELKKMAEAFAVRFKLEKCMSMSWLDGSNTKTRRYLWAPLKYGKYADNPVSVSVFVEKRNSDTCYRVSLEIKNDGDDKDIMKQYHSHLDIPLNVAAGLVYVSVSGSNEWGTPDILNKTQDEIKQEVESGKLKKVQICKYIDRKPDETNAYYHTEITKAIAAILPYYDHVAYEEFHPNRAENRLVKATLAKLQKLMTSAENSKEIRQLLTAFEMVDASVNYAKDFSQVVINRNTKDYEMLMQWSKVFLMNKSFTTFSGSTASRALLFPMESVYESYVAQQIKKVMSPEGWDVSSQDKGHYLFTEPRRQFAIRPDIVMKRGERSVILDTKWKSLVDNERVNYGISQVDMYQMYAYSKKYNTHEIWLLYPVNDEMRNHKPIRFESGDGTTVNLHFVDVDKIEESLQELRSLLEACE